MCPMPAPPGPKATPGQRLGQHGAGSMQGTERPRPAALPRCETGMAAREGRPERRAGLSDRSPRHIEADHPYRSRTAASICFGLALSKEAPDRSGELALAARREGAACRAYEPHERMAEDDPLGEVCARRSARVLAQPPSADGSAGRSEV